MRKIIIFFILISLLTQLRAQDPNMSQKDNYPLLLNPALAGTGMCVNRINGGFRGQWFSVPVSYYTGMLSFDRQMLKTNSGFMLGLGGLFLLDRAGEGTFSTYKPELTLSVGQYFGKNKRQLISAGISGGAMMHNLDYSGLKFDNQFSGIIYDTDLSSGELLNSKERYFYLNAGIQMKFQYGKKSSFDAGASFSNLNQPKLSFQGADVPGEYKIPVRYLAYAGATQFIGEKWGVSPYFFFQKQGEAQEILVKAEALYAVNENLRIGAGPGYRVNDAPIVYASLLYKQTKFGFSYDINTSGFADATGRRGSVEVSLTHHICRKGENVVSPIDFTETPITEVKPDTTQTDVVDSVAVTPTEPIAEAEVPVEKIEEPIPAATTPVAETPVAVKEEPKTPEPITPMVAPMVVVYFNNAEPANTQAYSQWYEKIDAGNLGVFYVEKIKGGYDALTALPEQIKKGLEQGYKVNITIAGYASTPGSSNFNNALIDRRIASVLTWLGEKVNLKDPKVSVKKENKGETGVELTPGQKIDQNTPEMYENRRVEITVVFTK